MRLGFLFVCLILGSVFWLSSFQCGNRHSWVPLTFWWRCYFLVAQISPRHEVGLKGKRWDEALGQNGGCVKHKADRLGEAPWDLCPALSTIGKWQHCKGKPGNLTSTQKPCDLWQVPSFLGLSVLLCTMGGTSTSRTVVERLKWVDTPSTIVRLWDITLQKCGAIDPIGATFVIITICCCLIHLFVVCGLSLFS